MSDRSYIQHGRRHGRRGSDPVDTGIAWALAWSNIGGSAPAIPGGASVKTYIDLPNFATNDAAIFDSGMDSFGGSVNTVRFLSEGVYKVHLSAQLSGPPAGQKVTLYWDPALIQSYFQYPNPDFIPVSGFQDDMGVWEIVYGDEPNDSITFPTGGGLWIETSGAGAFTALAQMYVEQISVSRIALN